MENESRDQRLEFFIAQSAGNGKGSLCKLVIELYARNVSKMLTDQDGKLLITSCNWTRDKLKEYFVFIEEVKSKVIECIY